MPTQLIKGRMRGSCVIIGATSCEIRSTIQMCTLIQECAHAVHMLTLSIGKHWRIMGW